MQHFIRHSHSTLDDRLDRLFQHRAENNLEPPHQSIDRKLGRVHKTLQCDRLQGLLYDAQTRQSSANTPDLLEMAGRELLLRCNLDSIMSRQIVRRDNPSQKVRTVTEVGVYHVAMVLPFLRQARVDGDAPVRFSSESDDVALFEADFLDPVFRERDYEG